MKGAKIYLGFVRYFSGFLVALFVALAIWAIVEGIREGRAAWANQPGDLHQGLDCQQLAAARGAFGYSLEIGYHIQGEGPRYPGFLLPDSVLLDFSGLHEGVAQVHFARANHVLAAADSINSLLPALLWAALFFQVWSILTGVLRKRAFFQPGFPRRIRWMALVILALPLQETACDALFNLGYARYFGLSPAELLSPVSSGLVPAFLFTLILLCLAEVARYGYALEEDQKLTI